MAIKTDPRLKSVLFECLLSAGALIRSRFDRPFKTRFKNNSPINLVTAVDEAADRLIRKTIRRHFPDHNLLTEESEPTHSKSPYKWVIDPLDGTTNFAHHFPQVGVSIGLELNGKIILSGVYDPFRNELFWAAKGKGAYMIVIPRGRRRGTPRSRLTIRRDDVRLHVSKTKTLQASLLMTGFPYDRNVRGEFYLQFVSAFLKDIQGIRRLGAAALDLCWVAAGRIDGYWEWRLKPWDCAAGSLIVEEAGGVVSDFAGLSHTIYGEQTLASNGLIHNQMVKTMQRIINKTDLTGMGPTGR